MTGEYVIRRVSENSVMIGPRDPYAEIIEALGAYADRRSIVERDSLRRLAWHLGMAGHPKACAAIMRYAGERDPEDYGEPGMYWSW